MWLDGKGIVKSMTKCIVFKLIYFLIFILNLYKIACKISDKRYCYDEKCSEPLSKAKTLLRYSSPDPDQRILSFNANADVIIYSKEAGSETDLWGAEIEGKRGYVNKKYVREKKVLKKPTVIVDTELKQTSQVPLKPKQDDIKPDTMKQPYEVIDGTPIYDNLYDSTTQNPILSTSNLEGSNETKEKPEEILPEQATDESVVDNVLSSFSKWLKDDEASDDDGEDDDEVDIEDGDEDNAEGDGDVDSVNKFNDASEKSDNAAPSPEKVMNSKKDSVRDETNLNNSPEIKLTNDSKATVISDHELNASVTDYESVANNNSLPSSSIEHLKDQKREQEVDKFEGVEASPNIETTTNETFIQEKQLPNMIFNKTTPNPAENKPEVYEVKSHSHSAIGKLVDPPSSKHTTVNSKQKSESIQAKHESAKVRDKLPSSLSEEIKNRASPELKKPNAEPKLDPVKVNDDGSKLSADKTEYPRLLEKVQNDAELKSIPTKVGSDVFETGSNLPDINTNQAATVEPTLSTAEVDTSAASLQKETTNHVPSVEPEGKAPTLNSSNIENGVPTLGTSQPKEFIDENNVTRNSIENNPSEMANLDLSVTKQVDPTTSKDSVKLSGADVNKAPDNQQTIEDVPKFSLFGNLFVNRDAPPVDIVENVLETNGTQSNSDETTVNHEDHSNENGTNSASQENLSKTEKLPVASEEETNGDAQTNLEETTANYEENLPKVEELPIAMIVTSEEETNHDVVVDTNEVSKDNNGFLASFYSLFKGNSNNPSSNLDPHSPPLSRAEETLNENVWASTESDSESCPHSAKEDSLTDVISSFNSDFLLYLVTTAISCIIFLFVYLAIDRNRREAPLVARINKLEKDLLVSLKENELLQERTPSLEENKVSNEVVEELQWKLSELHDKKTHLEVQVAYLQAEVVKKEALEEQVDSLEKELETSTEVGMELNRIISEMLDPTNGSEKLKENMDQLQRQLLEQKDTINRMSSSLNAKEMENCALHDDLQDSTRKAEDLQQRIQDVCEKMLRVESEKLQQCDLLQKDITLYRQKYDEVFSRNQKFNNDIQVLKVQLSEVKRESELKTKEYNTLKENISKIKSIKGEDDLKYLLDSTSMTAELEQLKSENERFMVQARQDQIHINEFERKYQSVSEELGMLTQKYEEVDKDKTEANMKLEVLNNYFKKRESELQEEVLKYKSIFDAKEGAATSTSERMKLLQEEIENYKSQNETLKQEIISQEIDLKSQISVLEKKVHENWVTARQTERKLEDTRQEAAQLRNRLTLHNRGGFDDMRTQNRIQSPVDQNGETTLSPHPSIESPASPPLLYGGRNHITKSPPLPGLPPPFLPPPPGAPFMPPPLPGMPHFMPPPPTMFPGDHRPPPLGRMSSPPPLNSRYSPGPLGYSPYDRNSPSPPYDSEYGTSPPVRGYSPFNGRDDRRDYKRPTHGRNKGRNMKGATMSSGSEHSNDSLDKMNRKQSKMV